MASDGAQKIIARADAMPDRQALWFLEENIIHHQTKIHEIVERDAKPKGWSFAAHSDLIADLITAKNERIDRCAVSGT